jgi:anti-sigma factor RsiW
MECRQAKKMTSQYVDGELSPDEKKGFDSHIRRCASCREGLEEAWALRRLFAAAERFPAPYGFAARVLANLEEQEGPRPRVLVPIRPFFLRAAQVAVALAVMAIGIFSGSLLPAPGTDHIGHTAVLETFSLDLFQATPPDSMGGIYRTLMRSSHER